MHSCVYKLLIRSKLQKRIQRLGLEIIMLFLLGRNEKFRQLGATTHLHWVEVIKSVPHWKGQSETLDKSTNGFHTWIYLFPLKIRGDGSLE